MRRRVSEGTESGQSTFSPRCRCCDATMVDLQRDADTLCERPVGAQALALEPSELIDAGPGQVEQAVELGAGEHAALARALDFHEATAPEADNVEIDLRGRVLR